MKKIKLLSLTLAASLLFSSIPVSANTQYTDSAHEVIDIDTPISNDNNSNCDVYAEIGSEFKVTIPKHITLDGATKSGSYKVTVEGDIAGTEKITVKPDSTFTLSSKNLPDVTAQVSQDKIHWKYHEILAETNIIANGLIGASEISAGAWNGSFNFNINLKNNSIEVQATDENDVDLNASAENIVDEEKESLLEELDKSGLANKEEVDAIVEVKSDEFENLAKTVFDVSDIAKPGDQVIVLHFDEETQEWEYISTETVADDGTVTVYMDSYSPVAFVKVENGITEHIHRYIEAINAPSCIEDGNKIYTCACGDTYTDIIDKTGHSYKETITAPTCTEKGYTTYVCEVCNDTYTDSIITETGHSFNNWTVVKAPNCLENGTEERNCTICNFVDTKEINALGHDFAKDYTVDLQPTCLTEGSKSQHCSRCEVTNNTTAIQALGHDYKQTVTNPTCTENGYTTNVCSRCNDTYVDNQVSATGHSYTSTITKEATCTEAGNKHYDCINCNYEYNEVIVAKGHVYDSTKYVTDVPATCTTDGQKSVHCNVCNAIITNTITSIPATGHSNVNGGTSAIHTKCNTCGVTTSTSHSYTSTITTQPTCTETGIRTYTCDCGYKYTETVNKLGHDYKQTVTNPTCTENGYTTNKCSRCNDTYTNNQTAAKGHTNINGGTSAIHTKCSVCGVTTNTSHSYTSSVATAATCTAKGTTKYTCGCGYSYTAQDIPAKGHNYLAYSTNGTQHWKACANGCGTTTSTGNHADGNNDSYCDTCNYKGTIVYTYHSHSGSSSSNSGCYTAIDYYTTNCGMSTSTVTGYYANCGYSNGEATGSYLSCTQSTAQKLVCTTPTSKLTCTTTQVLTCTQSTAQKLNCSQPASTLTCTQSTDKKLTCTQSTSKVLSCTTSVHSHSSSCYKTTSGGHSMAFSGNGSTTCHCGKTIGWSSQTCKNCGASVTSFGCSCMSGQGGTLPSTCSGNVSQTLTCTKTVHSHGSSCYTQHSHGSSCYTTHTHNSGCYTQHSHGSGCYTAHSHTSGCYATHTHDSGCYTQHSHGSSCYSTSYHYHSGSSSSGTGCYGGRYYHSHSGNSSSGGGCYGKAVYKLNCGMTTSTVISQYTKFN